MYFSISLDYSFICLFCAHSPNSLIMEIFVCTSFLVSSNKHCMQFVHKISRISIPCWLVVVLSISNRENGNEIIVKNATTSLLHGLCEILQYFSVSVAIHKSVISVSALDKLLSCVTFSKLMSLLSVCTQQFVKLVKPYTISFDIINFSLLHITIVGFWTYRQNFCCLLYFPCFPRFLKWSVWLLFHATCW